MATESEEEIQLKDVLDRNERTINKQQAEMRLLQAELLQLRSALLSRKEEASMLKGELRGKEREFRKLKAERAELVSRLDATKSSMQDFPGSDQSRLLEMYLLKRKETLKLVQYNNALRDREISKLERKLDGLQREISSKSTSPSQSKPDASAQASTFLENTLTPKALAKLQRHATKYGNSDQQRKVVADILGAGTYVMSDTGIRLPPLEDYSTRLHYREVEAATQRQRKTVKKLTCDKINAMCEIQSLKLRVDISEESNKGYRRQLDDMESVLKSVREKHRMEVETLKARQLELERQVSAMKRQNRTHRELMSGLKIENEMLKRELASSQQKSGTIRPRTQTAKSQPYKSARRTASRSSSNKDFPRS